MSSSSSSSSSSVEDVIVLELSDPLALEDQSSFSQDDVSISTSSIETWNLHSILRYKIVKVHTDRSRLVEESSYFRGLLGGSFSESGLHYVSVQWNIEAVVSVLQFLYSCSLNVTPDNFLLLLEAALFFGVDKLFLECEAWFAHITSARGLHTQQIPLETIVEIWNFGWEHGIFSFRDLCERYLAQHFVGMGNIM